MIFQDVQDIFSLRVGTKPCPLYRPVGTGLPANDVGMGSVRVRLQASSYGLKNGSWGGGCGKKPWVGVPLRSMSADPFKISC